MQVAGLLRPLILLGALGLLCLVGIGIGVARDDQPGDGVDSGFVKGLGALLVREKPLSGRDLRVAPGAATGCAVAGEELTIPPGQSCRFAIGDSRDAVRTLTLRQRTGTIGTITLLREQGATERAQLPAGRSVALDVFQRGGQVTIECARAAACRVALR